MSNAWKENALTAWAIAAVFIAVAIMLGWGPNCAGRKWENEAAVNERSEAKEGP